MEYKYCPLCGSLVQAEFHNEIKRWFCPRCRIKLYRNPTVGVAAVFLENSEILLVKRGLGVSYEGDWCIPCGHVEWGEDVRDACIREFLEETGLKAEIGSVVDVHSNFHDPKQLTVGIWFQVNCIGGKLKAGSDASDVRLFPIDSIPENMAFPTDLFVIEKIKRRMLCS